MKQTSLFDTGRAELVDILKASEMLGVSAATIRNWIKTGQLAYAVTDDSETRLFDRNLIEQFKKDLQNGKTFRLQSRANKRHSVSTFIPVEQLDSKQLLPVLQRYLTLINKHRLPVQHALLLHSLSVLKKANLIQFRESVSSIDEIECKNTNVKKLLEEWDNSLGGIALSGLRQLIADEATFGTDSLGILYQSLLDEGKKSREGSYYTPKTLIREIIDDLSDEIPADAKVLDPCCGTGQFLVSFSDYISDPLRLWGYDIDPVAVRIARINLVTRYPDRDFYPNIFVADSLRDNPDGRFDVIATNPPWGFHFSAEDSRRLRKTYPAVTSNEAFSYFLVRGLQLLHEGGYLCFVLPEAITKVRQHRDIRSYLLQNSTIRNIRHLGNVFSNVVSPVITLTIRKQINGQNEIEVIRKDGMKSGILQSRFSGNPDCTFDTGITGKDELLITKIYSHSAATLKDNAEWALGIVTGNNRRFLSAAQSEDTEGIIKGSDIRKYTVKPAASFIRFTPDKFQQVAPERKYRAKEKLLYRFITGELTFAYDNKQMLTLNSANILIPRIPGMPVKVVLAFLNSAVFQYLWKKKYNTVKVLRGDLEQLPFPRPDKKTVTEIMKNVDALLSGTGTETLEVRLDDLVSDSFGLTEEEKLYIRNAVK